MKLRRALLVAPMLLLLWVGVASAQVVGPDDYGGNLPTSLVSLPPGVTLPPGPEVESQGEGVQGAGGPLARTGSDNIVPLIQAAIVLLGAGTLLVLVARRRSAERRRHAAATATA